MEQGLRSHLHEHTYPGLLWRQPNIIRLLHAWNNLVLQRNWAVNGQLGQLLPSLRPGNLVVDAGCGEGQHLFRFAKKFPMLRFRGFDKNAQHIAFCKNYARLSAAKNRPGFSQLRLEDLPLENEADLLLCVGTLQYIEQDVTALANFFRALKPGGWLLLYVPVNGKRFWPFSDYLFARFDHYDRKQGRKRVYTNQEISSKLEAAGFGLFSKSHTYGTLGIASHETYSLLLMGLANSKGWWAWIFIPLLLLWLPFGLACSWWDHIILKKEGNGLLVLAQKRASFKSTQKPKI